MVPAARVLGKMSPRAGTATRLRQVHRRPAVRRPDAPRPDEARRVLFEQERLGPSVGYFLQLLAGVGWTSLPALPLIRQSTLILAGNDDPIIPLVNARIMRTLLPNASLHVYDDGHLGLLTSADELGPLVSGFLASHGGRTSEEQLTIRTSRRRSNRD